MLPVDHAPANPCLIDNLILEQLADDPAAQVLLGRAIQMGLGIQRRHQSLGRGRPQGRHQRPIEPLQLPHRKRDRWPRIVCTWTVSTN